MRSEDALTRCLMNATVGNSGRNLEERFQERSPNSPRRGQAGLSTKTSMPSE